MNNQTAQVTKAQAKRKRSIRLTREERTCYNLYAKKFDTKDELAENLGVVRGTIRTMEATGTCGPDTYEKLQAKIFNTQTAA